MATDPRSTGGWGSRKGGGPRRWLLPTAATIAVLTAVAATVAHQSGRGSAVAGPALPARLSLPTVMSGPTGATTPPALTVQGEPPVAPVTLPAPTSAQGFVPTGFPRSGLGAESAAWRWSSLMMGLDPDVAATAARVWAAPTYTDAPAGTASAASAERAALGVAATGPVGNAFVVWQPRMVRLPVNDPTRPVVDVLIAETAGSATGAQGSRTIVLELPLIWTVPGPAGPGAPAPTVSDWRVDDRALDATRVDTVVSPDSAAAYAAGWRDAVEAPTP